MKETEGVGYITVRRPVKKETTAEVKVEHYKYREGPEKVLTGCMVVLTIAIVGILVVAIKELTND